MRPKGAIVNVYVWKRLANVHRPSEDDKHYQADIIGPGFDHHAIAPTPAEALLLAAAHWRSHGDTNEPRPSGWGERKDDE